MCVHIGTSYYDVLNTYTCNEQILEDMCCVWLGLNYVCSKPFQLSF